LPAAAQNLCELSPTGMDTCRDKKLIKTEKFHQKQVINAALIQQKNIVQ
jgi:hypothetical protein